MCKLVCLGPYYAHYCTLVAKLFNILSAATAVMLRPKNTSTVIMYSTLLSFEIISTNLQHRPKKHKFCLHELNPSSGKGVLTAFALVWTNLWCIVELSGSGLSEPKLNKCFCVCYLYGLVSFCVVCVSQARTQGRDTGDASPHQN